MRHKAGFSLVELMISLALGLVISAAIIQVLISTSVTNKLNQAVAQVQESGRFITTRLTNELNEVGRYDMLTSTLDNTADPVVESAFVQNNPIAVAGDFSADINLGSKQGINGGNDELVVNLLGANDCTGNRHGYINGVEFHVVNHYFITGNEFKCTGYDGRVLRGLKNQVVTPKTVTLLDNVESFQLQFGISDVANTSQGQAIAYVTAQSIDALRAQNQQVVSLRWALLLKSYQNQIQQTSAPVFALLNESKVTLDTSHYYQVFTKTVALRNMKNFVRSAQ